MSSYDALLIYVDSKKIHFWYKNKIVSWMIEISFCFEYRDLLIIHLMRHHLIHSYISINLMWLNFDFLIVFLLSLMPTMFVRTKIYRHLSIITCSRHAWNYNVKRFNRSSSSTKNQTFVIISKCKKFHEQRFWHFKCTYLDKQTCSGTRNIPIVKNYNKVWC